MTTSVFHSVLQVVCLVALGYGLFLLFGLSWTLVLLGGGLFALSLSAELFRAARDDRRAA